MPSIAGINIRIFNAFNLYRLDQHERTTRKLRGPSFSDATIDFRLARCHRGRRSGFASAQSRGRATVADKRCRSTPHPDRSQRAGPTWSVGTKMPVVKHLIKSKG